MGSTSLRTVRQPIIRDGQLGGTAGGNHTNRRRSERRPNMKFRYTPRARSVAHQNASLAFLLASMALR